MISLSLGGTVDGSNDRVNHEPAYPIRARSRRFAPAPPRGADTSVANQEKHPIAIYR
jgi:hypothetical protein